MGFNQTKKRRWKCNVSFVVGSDRYWCPIESLSYGTKFLSPTHDTPTMLLHFQIFQFTQSFIITIYSYLQQQHHILNFTPSSPEMDNCNWMLDYGGYLELDPPNFSWPSSPPPTLRQVTLLVLSKLHMFSPLLASLHYTHNSCCVIIHNVDILDFVFSVNYFMFYHFVYPKHNWFLYFPVWNQMTPMEIQMLSRKVARENGKLFYCDAYLMSQISSN